MRDIKDYLIYNLLELRKEKEKHQFELIVKLSKLFKDPNSAYANIEWWVYDSTDKIIYITEPTNKIVYVHSPENLVDYLINEIGLQI